MKLFIDPYVSRLIEKLGGRGKLQTRGPRYREPLDTPLNRPSYSSPPDSNATSNNDEIQSSGRVDKLPSVNPEDA
jgi:hypothetical protein